MAQNGKTTLQLNLANNFLNANDLIIFVYGANTANTANNVAQTSVMTVTNYSNSFFGIVTPVLTLQTVIFSNLPTPANGMLINISDANVATWGTNITIGGGTHNVLARYNGTNWTVVGV